MKKSKSQKTIITNNIKHDAGVICIPTENEQRNKLEQLKTAVKKAVDAAKNHHEVLNVCEQFKEDQALSMREYDTVDSVVGTIEITFKIISEELNYHIKKNNLQGVMPEWKKTRTMDISRWVTEKRLKIYKQYNWDFQHLFEYEFDSWDGYFKRENEAVETFINTGEYIGMDYMPIDEFADEDGVFNVLKKSFDLYIKLFENYKYALTLEKANNEFAYDLCCIVDDSDNLYAQFHHLDGRLSLKDKQKKLKINSGKGQKEAQAKRVYMLVESLKNYIKDDTNSITMNKNEFCKLVCQTFIGAELTPRHPAVIKDYHKKAEQILSMKINLTRK